MTTEDILRRWFKPIRPHLALTAMLAPVVFPVVQAVHEGRETWGWAAWIIFWSAAAALNGLYTRAPRRTFPWTRSGETLLDASLERVERGRATLYPPADPTPPPAVADLAVPEEKDG